CIGDVLADHLLGITARQFRESSREDEIIGHERDGKLNVPSLVLVGHHLMLARIVAPRIAVRGPVPGARLVDFDFAVFHIAMASLSGAEKLSLMVEVIPA